MLQYKAVDNQNIFDVCLNTYGTLDLLNKLLEDNKIDNVNINPASGQLFTWDETLTADQAINQISQNTGIIYATKYLKNSMDASVITGTPGKIVSGGNAIGLMPDIPIVPTDARKLVYIGYVTNLNPDESIIKAMESRLTAKSNQSYIYNINTKRYCYAHPAIWGEVISVINKGGFDILSGFTKTVVSMTNMGVAENYNVLTLTMPTSQTDYNVNFKFI